ncbi:MAG: glycosyltransferase family 2 protein [Candidatus Methylomirabilales bacterium]
MQKDGLHISIVIPTFNRAQLLPDLLQSLGEIVIPPDTEWEILVVDNNSSDETAAVTEGFIGKGMLPLSYVFESKQGLSHARNAGIREAKGQVIAFVDDDEIVDRQWMVGLDEGFKRFECSGIGGRVIAKWKSVPPDWYCTEGPYRIVGATSGHDLGETYREYSLETLMPIGGNLALKRTCFEKYGYFRTDIGPIGANHHYTIGEDVEFCLRLILGGERLIYSPEALVHNIVHEDRVTKSFCKSFYFRYGMMQTYLYRHRAGRHNYLGVPRYLFRDYLETFLAWGAAVVRGNSKAKLFYHFGLSRIWGQIYQHLVQNHPYLLTMGRNRSKSMGPWVTEGPKAQT